MRVGTQGFRLAALNTDSVGGPTACHWVALGCGPACGSRTFPALPSIVIKPSITIRLPFPFVWAGASQLATVVDAQGLAWEAERFECSSSQPEVATVLADGRIQVRKSGQALLMARGEGGEAKVELDVRAVAKRPQRGQRLRGAASCAGAPPGRFGAPQSCERAAAVRLAV